MDFIEKIKRRLSDELPGLVAQQKMAPNIRNIEALWKKYKPSIRNSAVLVLLYFDKEWKTVLIKRPEYNGPHSNQISFPGGKQEPEDKDLIETAIRESKEEIGLNPENLEILGLLSPIFIPVSNSKVQPVVAYVKTKPDFVPSDFEVEAIIEMEISLLVKEEIRKTETIMVEDRHIDAPYFEIGNRHVWGATAMMLSEFSEIIRDCPIQK